MVETGHQLFQHPELPLNEVFACVCRGMDLQFCHVPVSQGLYSAKTHGGAKALTSSFFTLFEILFSFLLSCAVCFQQAHVFTVSTYSNFVGHTQRAWTFASFLVPVKNSHWGSVEEKSPRAFDFGIRGKSQIP